MQAFDYRTICILPLAAACSALAAQSVLLKPLPGIAIQIDQNAEQNRLAAELPDARLLASGSRVRRVWGTRLSSGNSPEESAERFMKSWSGLWGVPFSQLAPIGPFEDGAHLLPLLDDGQGGTDFTAAYWSQHVAGIPVFRSHVWGLIGNEPGHPMVLAGGTLRSVGDFEDRLVGRSLDPAALPAVVAQAIQTLGYGRSARADSPRFVVWAGVDDDVPEPRLAAECLVVEGSPSDPAGYRRERLVVDVETADVLHSENLIVHGVATAQINALATPGPKAAACTAATLSGLPYVRVDIGSQAFYTDAYGKAICDYSGTAPAVVAPVLNGRYFTVTDMKAPIQVVESQSVASGGSATFQFPSISDEFQRSQVDTYLAANVERDFVLARSPSYPTIATQVDMAINNGVAGTCNAYYDGSSINFFSSGGGCNNTGYSSVVFHEYGHHMVSCAGSGQSQFGEGFGDVMSVLMLDDPVLGYGFQSCSSGIRNAQNTCVGSRTTSTCGSEIHAWGQVLSGCVWDLRNAYAAAYPTDYRARLARLAINEVPLHAGQSDIWKDITIDYMTLDDAPSNGGDNNLANGCPNFTRIDTAFTAHGLKAPALLIKPDPLPTFINALGGTTLAVKIESGLSTLAIGTPTLKIRESGQTTFQSIPLVSLGLGWYLANFPSVTMDSTVEFYFSAGSPGGGVTTIPDDAPTTLYRRLASTLDRLSVVGWGAGLDDSGGGSSYGQALPKVIPGLVQLEAGWLHTLALRGDGTVMAWGWNAYGQCNVPAGLTDVVQVSGGDYHSLALKSNGTVVAWGSDSSGQVSVPAGLAGVRQVAAGGYHSIAVRSNGTVVGWGSSSYGRTTPPAGLADAIQVSAGGYHSAARRREGSVVCFGYDGYGQSTVPADVAAVRQVSCGWYHTGALLADGSVRAWGYASDSYLEPPPGLPGIVELASGDFHFVALASDGSVLSWGSIAKPPVTIGRAKHVASGGSHGLAIRGCFSDLDGDGMIGLSDAALVLLDYGPCVNCPSDIDGSGVVDDGDVALILLDFGPCM